MTGFAAPSRRLVAALREPALGPRTRRALAAAPPSGVLLEGPCFGSPAQLRALVDEVRSLADPAPLVLVRQEGGEVDPLGPLLGRPFPSAQSTSARGAHVVHEAAYLMGRAARLLGVDADLAPVLDLTPARSGAAVASARTYGFHVEDVVVAGTVFVHGLARAGVASFVAHFPGLGRATRGADGILAPVDAHDVDLMVTDVAPFARLASLADGVLVGQAVYPDLTGAAGPASQQPAAYRLLRERLALGGLALADDAAGGAPGSAVDRAVLAVGAGCDAVITSAGPEEYEATVVRLAAAPGPGPASADRLARLARRCGEAPRPVFTDEAWSALADEVGRFLEELERPRTRPDDEAWGARFR